MQLIDSRIYEAIKQALGPEILQLLEDDNVIEILRNANGVLCVERLGSDIEEVMSSLNDRKVESLIRLLASHTNDICNDKNPSLAIKLPYWHARFQALLPPVVSAPSFSIRKHARHVFTLEHYLKSGTLNHEQYEVVIQAVARRENIIISGGCGSGKTTIANALLNEMDKSGHRIITVEDTPELRLVSALGLQIYTKTAIGYGSQQALKDILRMRPDRIVLGELRDGACLDLIKAWNTGHSGGITTIHANSAELAIKRVESLVAEVSVNVPRELIAQTVNLIIHVTREGSKRVVSEITRMCGFKDQGYIFKTVGRNNAEAKTSDSARYHCDVVYLSGTDGI